MGTEYYIARHDKKELYELGKHLLNHLIADENKSWTISKSKLLEEIMKSLTNKFNYQDITCDHALSLRDEIFEWMKGINKDIEIVSEHNLENYPFSDEKFQHLYKITGSRYLDANS